ncbi:hypothetical protein [Streptomyces violaceusniger]|uniref:hypothetical protein n=1 Tax=Streptomyces violaceusniger TaxID=68280 RepID=UPI002073900A|nr:hypothetical protein [Streptomyces violaceusniger]
MQRVTQPVVFAVLPRGGKPFVEKFLQLGQRPERLLVQVAAAVVGTASGVARAAN